MMISSVMFRVIRISEHCAYVISTLELAGVVAFLNRPGGVLYDTTFETCHKMKVVESYQC